MRLLTYQDLIFVLETTSKSEEYLFYYCLRQVIDLIIRENGMIIPDNPWNTPRNRLTLLNNKLKKANIEDSRIQQIRNLIKSYNKKKFRRS